MPMGWLRRLWSPARNAPPEFAAAGAGNRPKSAIPDDLWQTTLGAYPFLLEWDGPYAPRLRALCDAFLRQKEFYGAHGLTVTDGMAVAIAAQACLPVLHFGPPAEALAWYGDFVGIVVHADEVVARREAVDDAGVVHQYDEVLAGEAMEGGPVTLAWKAVAESGESASDGYNVVIHEFVHKIDMHGGGADGCPALPPGFMGTVSRNAARRLWLDTLSAAYYDFREKVVIADRFGGDTPWLDAYGAESLPEFFAVACEAYFVHRDAFSRDFDALLPLFDAFFLHPTA